MALAHTCCDFVRPGSTLECGKGERCVLELIGDLSKCAAWERLQGTGGSSLTVRTLSWMGEEGRALIMKLCKIMTIFPNAFHLVQSLKHKCCDCFALQILNTGFTFLCLFCLRKTLTTPKDIYLVNWNNCCS